MLRQQQANKVILGNFDIHGFRDRYIEKTGSTSSRTIIRDLLLLMLGGDYTNDDIMLAYELLHPDNAVFDLSNANAIFRLTDLFAALSAHPNFNLQ